MKKNLLLLFILLPSLAQGAAGDDLLLHWRFDSPYQFGFVEPDGSGHSNDGLLVWARTRGGGGGEYVPEAGVFGGAGIVRPRGAFFSRVPFKLPEEWTLAFWVKPADQIDRTDTIITFTDVSREKTRFNLGNRGNRFSISTDVDGSKGGGRFDTNNAYSLDDWHHVAVAYSKDRLAFYLNGKGYVVSHKLPWKLDKEVCLQLAGRRGGPHNRFTGLYDDVRIYGGILDKEAIAALADAASEFYANEGLPPVADPGVGYSAWLGEKGAVMTLDGGCRFPGQNGGTVGYQWEVVSAPDGARWKLADSAEPASRLAVTKAGAYELRLTVTNNLGRDSALVKAVVFDRDLGPQGGTTLFEREPWSVLGIEDLEPSRPERVAACKGPIAPLAYWTFDETEGTTAKGTGPKGRSVALMETISLAPKGKPGGALAIQPEKHKDAILDFGVIPELREEFSISLWIKSDRTSQKAALFYARGENGREYWRIHNQHNTAKIPGYSSLSFGNNVGSPIHLGQRWNHIVVAYSPKHDFRKLYLNGHLVAARKFRPLSTEGEGSPRLVFNNPGDNYSFEGFLDEVAVFDVMLNNEEVRKLFTEGVSGLSERVPEDPYKTGAYRKAFVEKWFPELKPKPVEGKAFEEERFDAVALQPYSHPRLFFTLDDLPRLRAQCRHRAGNRVISQLRQYSEVANRGNPDGSFGTDFTMDKAGSMLAEAYVTLLEADTENARRIIDWMMACAEHQQRQIDETGDEKLFDWQHSGHNILLRYGTPLLYDWMYNWMTPAERATIREVIAACTQDRWSIGMYGHPAWSSGLSNWQPWLTGEMMLALQSIYREDGFDAIAYEAASRATALCALLMADEESGASYEGMAKNNMQLEMYALVSRTQPRGHKLIGSQMPYNHVAKFLFHNMAPWGGEIMKDDALGGMSSNLEDVSVAVMHYAYPDDPIINYMKHNSAGRRDSYSNLHLNTFSQNSPPMIWSFVQDWSGPNDLDEHLKQAVAKANEPLGYFSNYRGLMISRSDWTPDALQLYFQPRCVRGGHPIPARGYFRLNALGRTWVPFNGAYPFQSSEYHSVVTVGGVGQDNTVGKVLSYDGAAENAGALVDIMGCDLTGAYRQTDGRIYRTHNEPRLYPDTERPWMDMDKRFLVHWWRADRPSGNVSMPVEDWAPKQDFVYAYRTAALVRGKHPFVLIIDDIKKDEQPREYNWSMMIPQDIYEAKSYELTDKQVILTDPADRTKHLLVLPISVNGRASFDTRDMYGQWRDKKGHVYKLNYRCQGTESAFRMLLYSYRDGEPVPKVAGRDSSFTVTIGNQKKSLQIVKRPGGISKISIR
jgi:hypothetical protein